MGMAGYGVMAPLRSPPPTLLEPSRSSAGNPGQLCLAPHTNQRMLEISKQRAARATGMQQAHATSRRSQAHRARALPSSSSAAALAASAAWACTVGGQQQTAISSRAAFQLPVQLQVPPMHLRLRPAASLQSSTATAQQKILQPTCACAAAAASATAAFRSPRSCCSSRSRRATSPLRASLSLDSFCI